MRRFYSFMLMATMLLIGANAWAENLTVGTGGTYANLAAAVNAATNGQVIELVSPVTENAQGAQPVWINKDLTLDLKNFQYLYKGTGSVFIGITSGSLTIKGSGAGKLQADGITEDLIRIYGTYEKKNAKEETPYSQLIIENGATIQSNNNAISIDVMRKGQAGKFGKTDADIPYSVNFFHKAGSGYGVANGVKIVIAGKVFAYKYGIKCNGTVRNGKEFASKAADWYTYEYPSQGAYVATANDEPYSPYIHITSLGQIETTDVTYKKAVAVYASGFARWLIEGYCTGSSGVYVKSGDVDINGATVASNFEGTYDPILSTEDTKSGVLGAGSAIAVESNQNYSGDIDVTISGGSTLTAGTGYALEESVAASTGTKVDAITVEGATFNSGNQGAGAITISETTTNAALNQQSATAIEVSSAVVKGNIVIGGTHADPVSGDPVANSINDLTKTSVVIEPAPNTDEPTIVVPLDITLTADGYASYSAPLDLFKKPGSNFNIYTGTLTGDVLMLHEVNYVEAGQGVILYSDTQAKCHFTSNGTADNSYDHGYGNDLKPSSAWVNQIDRERIYCLRFNGNTNATELFKYVGVDMPNNKAYLDLNAINSAPAPARIRMVIAGTQDIENVANEAVKAQKFIENGQVFIKRGEKVYNVQGQNVK